MDPALLAILNRYGLGEDADANLAALGDLSSTDRTLLATELESAARSSMRRAERASQQGDNDAFAAAEAATHAAVDGCRAALAIVDPEPEPEPAPEPEAVAADGRQTRRPVPPSLRPRPRASQPSTARLVSSEGVALTLEEAGRLFVDRADWGRGGVVASLRVQYPENRTLPGEDSAAANGAKIDAVVASLTEALREPDALVAAGGICAPPDARYVIEGVATARRPLRDSLPSFDGSRGSVQYVRPVGLGDVAGAVGFWPESLDESPGAATKPVLTVSCPSVQTATIDAITQTVRVGNFHARTFPEQFQNIWETATSAHSREAEDRIWEAMCTASTAVTSGSDVLGATRDLLVHMARAATAMRYRERAALDAPVMAWLPEWAGDLMAADLTRQLPGDNAISVGRSEIEGYLRTKGIIPVWSPDAGDQSIGVEAGGALQGWPLTVEVVLAFPGTFIFLDGGMLDLGVQIVDSGLISTNERMGFTESFETVFRAGPQALCLTANVCPSGETSATTDVTGVICTTGS